MMPQQFSEPAGLVVRREGPVTNNALELYHQAAEGIPHGAATKVECTKWVSHTSPRVKQTHFGKPTQASLRISGFGYIYLEQHCSSAPIVVVRSTLKHCSSPSEHVPFGSPGHLIIAYDR